MHKKVFDFQYEVYESSSALNDEDRDLLKMAYAATSLSYAPYSNFKVGAAARLTNGEIITGGNQENASFPAGLCAEGVVLAASAARFPSVGIRSLAISYASDIHKNDIPITPCGICRQSLQEFQQRTATQIRLIMGGREGEIIIVPDASYMMPLAFKF